MALTETGLEAVIKNLSNFESGAKTIQKAYDDIEKKAGGVERSTGSLSSKLSALGSPLASLGGQFAGLGGSILKVGAIAGGAALLGVGALTAGIVALGASALSEFAKFERLELSIQNLVARDIAQGKEVEQSKQVKIQLTEKETKELEKLKRGLDNEVNSRDVLTARIQEQKEKIRQLTAQYGDNGLVVIKERAELQGMELDLVDLNSTIETHQGRISELTGKQGQLVTAIEKVRVGQMSMSDAMEQAGPKAQELLKWIQLLAIQSPFNQEGIANAFQTALAYGFTTEQAQRLTNAEVDFSAATGKSIESANQIALALGQMQAKGKVSGQEIIQLTNAGVGVNKILEDMGFTLDDVSNGLVDSDKFIEAVITDMEIFKGAAKEQSGTFAGLIASLEDLKGVGLREFFTGTFKAIQPYLSSFVDTLVKAALETGGIRALGDILGTVVASSLKKISDLVTIIQSKGLGGLFASFGFVGSALFLKKISELFQLITGDASTLGTTIQTVLGSAFTWLTTNLFPMLSQGIQFIIDHFEEFKGAMLGVGAVLGGAVFAALLAGLFSLLTPINLIIAGAALLGAAWAGNWGGIQEKTATAWAVIQPLLAQLAQWLQVNIPIAIQATVNFWNGTLYPALMVVGNYIMTTVVPTLSSLWDWLQANLPAAIQVLSDIWNTVLYPAITMFIDYLVGTVFPTYAILFEWLGTTLVAGLTVLSDTWNNILLPALTAVWSFINDPLLPLFEAVGMFVNAVLNKAIEAMAGLWQNVLWPAIKKVADLLSTILQPAMTVIADLLEKKVTKAIQKGEKIMIPFAKGIERVIKAVKDLTGYFKALADVVGNFTLPPVLTPGSPTPFEIALMGIAGAANQAGIAIQAMGTGFNIAPTAIDALLGIQRGVAGVHEIIGSARDDLEDWFEQFPVERSKIKLALSQINSLFHQNADEILGATDRVAAFQAVLKRATERGGMSFEFLGFDPFGGKGGGALSVFLQAFDKQKEKLEKLQLQIFQMAGRTALTIGNKLNDVIQGSADILNDRVESLQELVESGLNEVNFEGQIISATRAQELFNEALAEQRSIQDDLLELRRNEQRLGFLEKQLNLIETIQGAGLDPAEILGGLRLGMDASIPDLIEATNRLVTAMIDQVNTDLQIGSPSKVLFKQGEFAGQGLIGGFLDQMPNLAGVIQRAISAPAMVSAPALGTASGGSVTNIYQMGGNTISNGMNEAQFAARVMQVIRGALR